MNFQHTLESNSDLLTSACAEQKLAHLSLTRSESWKKHGKSRAVGKLYR